MFLLGQLYNFNVIYKKTLRIIPKVFRVSNYG